MEVYTRHFYFIAFHLLSSLGFDSAKNELYIDLDYDATADDDPILTRPRSIDVEIPDQYVGWIVAAWGAVMGWLLNMQRQILARPTREERAAEAALVATGVKEQFNEIKLLLERQNDSATRDRQSTLEHRQWVGDSLADIRTKVAVLRDRAGDDPLGDTGAHRRRL